MQGRIDWMGTQYAECDLPVPPRPEGLPYAPEIDWESLNNLWMLVMGLLMVIPC